MVNWGRCNYNALHLNIFRVNNVSSIQNTMWYKLGVYSILQNKYRPYVYYFLIDFFLFMIRQRKQTQASKMFQEWPLYVSNLYKDSSFVTISIFDANFNTSNMSYDPHINSIFFKYFAEIFNFNFLGWWFVSQKIGRSRWFAIFSTWNLVLAKAISRSDNQRHARISDSVYSFFCCWAFQVRIKTIKIFIRYTLKSKKNILFECRALYHLESKERLFLCSWLDYFTSYLVNISMTLVRIFKIGT